ncbi:recombinase family protein [Bradyrhizobium sp. Ai1a-2]|uniref:recombinase family protein n=1 Tax=Bradyrhizobium sp. Ai1a-2 TaxID=196490 RepID=UPI0013648674|nr:recombinase family protein [Bradyrhizobium sp. Ai1a-2]
MSHSLPTSSSDAPIRAAQYLRMSSENQRYSTENQQNAIAEYARQHGYQVVATYVDVGKSGLSLKGRDALRQLLSDALATERAFDAIMVLDVSRWGRFQNPDQAAHYEFLCRQAGLRVIYCAEPFGEDVAPITTIVKHLKRVMAGEYSRELSTKLARAHRQQAELGFRQGAKLVYGFRRLLVDSARKPRQVLANGERKALDNDKVIVIPGPPEELAVIRRIFRLYVRSQLSIVEIARRFAKEGIKGYGNDPLSPATIRTILSSELCIGRMTYNRTSHRLQGRVLKTPESSWTRFAAFEPIVPVSLFRTAQERRARCRSWDKPAIAASLKKLLAQEGYHQSLSAGTSAEALSDSRRLFRTALRRPTPRLSKGLLLRKLPRPLQSSTLSSSPERTEKKDERYLPIFDFPFRLTSTAGLAMKAIALLPRTITGSAGDV